MGHNSCFMTFINFFYQMSISILLFDFVYFYQIKHNMLHGHFLCSKVSISIFAMHFKIIKDNIDYYKKSTHQLCKYTEAEKKNIR